MLTNSLSLLESEKSIVVLPFKNLSGDNEYDFFCDGITEEIINALSKVSGLKVIARASSFAYQDKSIDIRIIGNELGVTNAVDGSIRISKSRIRISAQLTRTDNGFLLWSENFDRTLEDIFELQDEISVLIAEKIRENFGHFDIEDSLVNIHTNNLKAYQWFLKGKHLQLSWNLPDIEKAIFLYQKSIEQDPNFADAYLGAGWCYGILASWGHIDRTDGHQKALYYLEKGNELDTGSYLFHFAKATISFWGNWRYDEGYDFLSKCLAVNPYFTEGREALSELYTALGLFDEALVNTDQILAINPLSPNHYYTKGNIFYLQEEYEKALDCFETSIQLSPSFELSMHLKAACLLQLNEKEKLFSYLDATPHIQVPELVKELYYIIHENKHVQDGSMSIPTGVNSLIPWLFYYQVYTQPVEESIEKLAGYIEFKVGQFINFQFDPFLKPLKNDPSYLKLVEENYAKIDLLQRNRSEHTNKQSGPFTEDEVEYFKETLLNSLSTQRRYLEPSISLREIADDIGITSNKLSWLINDQLKVSFNELINQYRLSHFMEIALDPANAHLTLLGLAYESGFNSKTVFNTFFKKETGSTPRQWLKSKKSESI